MGGPLEFIAVARGRVQGPALETAPRSDQKLWPDCFMHALGREACVPLDQRKGISADACASRCCAFCGGLRSRGPMPAEAGSP